MINSVRNTVLSILSKDNRGYVTPEEFNLFAKNAQLEIFEGLFYKLSSLTYNQNKRIHGSGYIDLPAVVTEAIDIFSHQEVLTYNAISGKFYKPGTEPTNTTPSMYKLDYLGYNFATEIESVPKNKIQYLLNTPNTAPTTTFPVYTLDENGIKVYPTTIISNVVANYVRYPYDPKWTYTTLSGGEPLFNQSAADYQDFELPKSEETNLVIKILQYAGLSIDESDITQLAKAEETQDKQEKL